MTPQECADRLRETLDVPMWRTDKGQLERAHTLREAIEQAIEALEREADHQRRQDAMRNRTRKHLGEVARSADQEILDSL